MNRPFSILIRAILFFAGTIRLVLADTEPLHHYGVATIKDGKAESAFAARFNAQGRPLFLIGDLEKGVAIGDIIRFRDKVVLIDAQVWQTMKSTGVLDDIQNAAVVGLTARSTSGVWKSRADLAAGKEKIAYTLGAEFISVLEDYFGAIPDRMEMTFRFEGERMTLLAPTEMLGLLNFVSRNEKGKASVPDAKIKSEPSIISDPPLRGFTGEAFAWTVWAVDPGYPSAELTYSSISKLPPGLSWDQGRHAITGKPSRPGLFEIKVKVVNSAKRADELVFKISIAANQHPKIWGEPNRETQSDGSWRFQPLIADADHLSAELKVEPVDLPKGLDFDRETRTFVLANGKTDALEGIPFGLKVTDPLGAIEERSFTLGVSGTDFRFRSALGVTGIPQGQRAYYAPVAVGPGHEIRYWAATSGGQSLPVTGGRFPLSTESPGTHVVEFTAEDELGNHARQLLTYQVFPKPGLFRSLSLSGGNLGGTELYDATYRFGFLRYGLLRSGPWNSSLPFFLVGFSPISEGARKNHSLFIDLGFNAQGSSGLTYGGFMTRLDGRFHRFGEDALVFNYGVHYHARQGIVLLDPYDYRHNDLDDNKLEKCLQDLRSRTDRADSLVAGFLACDDGARTLIRAYGDGSNEVFQLRFDLWLHTGHALYSGPVYWLEDRFHSQTEFEQRLGFGLTRHSRFNSFGFDITAKVGFASTAPLAKFLLDISMRFGRED